MAIIYLLFFFGMIGAMKKMVFVCHGSICRSPAAEMIARMMSSDYEFVSYALSYEEIGNDIYPPMKRELTRQGIPFSRHYADYLPKEVVESASYIFYMDESNRRRLVRAYPEYQAKYYPVFYFTPSIDEIEDPWYTDRYEVVVNQLKRCIADILANLRP